MPIISSVGDFLKKTVIMAATSTNDRVPFLFTSAYRLAQNGGLGNTTPPSDQTLAQIQTAVAGLPAAQNLLSLGSAVAGGSLLKVNINGAQVLPIIQMAVNPQSVSFSQPKRVTKVDTKKGSTFFFFTDSYGRNDDILTMSFSGVSGNINANADDLETANLPSGNTYKLQIWHELFNITHEPVMIPGFGKNEMIIQYASPLFRSGIKLTGFYQQALEFGESSDSPYLKPYRFGFTVTRTDPPLWTIINTVNTALANGVTNVFTNI